MTAPTTGERRAPRDLIICFIDLSFFTQDAKRFDDDEQRLADHVDSFYARVAEHVERAGGNLVKFIGDAALIVFEPERADDALAALTALKAGVDKWLTSLGWQSRLVVKVHCGSVVAGDYGSGKTKRFDVIGNTVNATARLQTRSYAITPQVFRLLSADARKGFKKHTPPILYIPTSDPRP
jgi:class 3 adenylate cyclase